MRRVPWVEDLLQAAGIEASALAAAGQGQSCSAVRRLYDGPQAYTLQSSDGRVVFLIPYEEDFTLIGTTDIPFTGDATHVSASETEIAYLFGLASEYLKRHRSRRRISVGVMREYGLSTTAVR